MSDDLKQDAGPHPDQPPDPVAMVESLRIQVFQRSVLGLTPRVFVTHVIVGLNVAAMVALLTQGVSPWLPPPESLVPYGANVAPLTTNGQWWRLLSATFIHYGVLHLAMNMYVLWGVGQFVERLVGNIGLVVLYLLSGLAGSLASTWWNPAFAVGAGASGAVLGVYGALLGFMLRQRHVIPTQVLSRLRSGAIIFLGLNLMLGFSVEGIDMAAHLGGLLCGFLCGMALSHPLRRDAARRRWLRNGATALVGASLVLAAIVVLPKIPEDPRVAAAHKQFLKDAQQLERRCLDSWAGGQQRHERGEINDAELATLLEGKVLPCWRALVKKLRLPDEPPKEQRVAVERLRRYLALRRQAWQLQVEALRQKDAGKLRRAMQQHEAATVQISP
jgi:membrane associated rhomboid family serine protease